MFDIASLVEYSELFADTLSNASYVLFQLFQFLASEWIEFEVDVGWGVEKFITVLNLRSFEMYTHNRFHGAQRDIPF